MGKRCRELCVHPVLLRCFPRGSGMEERRKKRSPRGQLAPTRASRLLPTSRSASFPLPLPALPSQRARPRRSVLGWGERAVLGGRAGGVTSSVSSVQGEQGEGEGRGSTGGPTAAQLPHRGL